MPQRINYKIRLGQREYIIAFAVEENTTEERMVSQSFKWTEATLPLGKPKYEDVVAAIVKGKYNDNQMTALINNHLMVDNDEEHEIEWAAMQEWRAEAKKLAKEIIAEISQQYENG